MQSMRLGAWPIHLCPALGPSLLLLHNHKDHFAGFDRQLRLMLYRDKAVTITDSTPLRAAVEAKPRTHFGDLYGERFRYARPFSNRNMPLADRFLS